MLKIEYYMHPKKIQADNGKEYMNKELLDSCHAQGIHFEFTAPYSPQQNGIAERYNRTLEELMQAMLTARHLSTSLWSAGIQHAAYWYNHSYTHAIPNCTPYEHWFKERPDVAHLREFGKPVYVLCKGENQSKVQPKALKHTFISFEDPISHQIKTSRNFTFMRGRKRLSADIGDASSSQGREGTNGMNQSTESRKRKRETYSDSGLPHCSTRPTIIEN